MRSRLSRSAVVLVLAVFLAGAQGCAAVRYCQHRGEDLLDIVDLGLTITKTPQLGLYWNSLDILVAGYSNIDGYFVGWGGGQLGVTRHYNKCYGLLISHEEHGWGDFDKDDPSTLYTRQGGWLGTILFPQETTPAYTPACVHYFPHLGYVGLVWSARWMEMVDFALGFAYLDIAGDDGYKPAKWSFPRRSE